MSKTIFSSILEVSERHPDKIAIVAGKDIVSYRDLRSKIFSAASLLSKFGIEQGDRVVLSASHSPSFVYGYFATHLLGAIAVPVDPLIPVSRMHYIIGSVEPKVIFTLKNCIIDGHVAREIGELDTFEEARNVYPHPRPEDVSDILFTTGTSGNPKGVVLTHHNITHAANNINAFIRNGEDDREVVPLPLSHSFGLGRLRCTMAAGGTIILTEGFTYPGKIFQAMEFWKATGFSFVPAALAFLFRLSGDEIGKFSNQLRYIEIGSAPMQPQNKLRLMNLLPKTRICMHYGLTEASRSTFIEFHEDRDKLHSIGKASPRVEVKVFDEHLRELPSNKSGRIFVRGKMVMKGYWRDEDLTKSAFHDGWLNTGDIGFRDADGYFYLVGREGDIINVGGLKVSPVEVEDALLLHEGIENCGCIAIPDPGGITGEAVKAYLVAKNFSYPKPAPDELIDFLKGKLEPYKIPVAFEWVESLPQTASGKIRRDLLRQKASQ